LRRDRRLRYPDGRYLVVAAAVNGKLQLRLRPLDALQAHPMAFTEDATFPFWSWLWGLAVKKFSP
jgi:hypothetical protein